jgi:hypothetical protein
MKMNLMNKTGEFEPVRKPLLEKGQIIWLNGYGQNQHSHDRLAITEIKSNTCETVNIDQPGRIQTHSIFTIRPVSELFGIGIYYTPGEFATPEEIEKGLVQVHSFVKQQEEKAERERIEKADYKKTLGQKYKHLRQTSKEEPSRVTAAKNIRIELKTAFPSVKFSVKTKSFSNGNDINISWENGVTTEEVEKITSKYQYGSFDGMDDCYKYSDDSFNDMFGGSKYVMENRDVTKDKYIEVAKKLGYDVKIDERWVWDVEWDTQQMIQSKVYKTSFL